MSSTRLSKDESDSKNLKKKRSSQHQNSHRPGIGSLNNGIGRSNASVVIGKWKTRQIRHQIKNTSPEDDRKIYELLKRFNGKKDFSLPPTLPPWIPPRELENINSELKLIRDYNETNTNCSPNQITQSDTNESNPRDDDHPMRNDSTGKLSRSTSHHPANDSGINETSNSNSLTTNSDFSNRSTIQIPSFKKLSQSRQQQSTAQASSSSQPSKPLPKPSSSFSIPALQTNSSSISPNTYSSPPEQVPTTQNHHHHQPSQKSRTPVAEGKKRSNEDDQPVLASKSYLRQPSPEKTSNSKGKEKRESDVDWTEWEAKVYTLEDVDRIRFKYEQRAKELKRLSDRQRHQLSLDQIARENPDRPRSTLLSPEEIETISDLATIESVDSLLLFTQSFLCSDLNRFGSNGSHNRTGMSSRAEHYRQWDSMLGFLSIAKSTARKSGIDLAYALCLMYESLLLDLLVEAERPMLLQNYSQTQDPEKMLEGFSKLKKLLVKQEHSKESWRSSQNLFQKIFSSPISTNPSSSSSSTNSSSDMMIDSHSENANDGERVGDNKVGVVKDQKKQKNFGLPKLRRLIDQMRVRTRDEKSPILLSMDQPFRFCWPIEKGCCSNSNRMTDIYNINGSNPSSSSNNNNNGTGLGGFDGKSMVDFVVFARAGLDEWLEISGSSYQLGRFDDQKVLFPKFYQRLQNLNHRHGGSGGVGNHNNHRRSNNNNIDQSSSNLNEENETNGKERDEENERECYQRVRKGGGESGNSSSSSRKNHHNESNSSNNYHGHRQNNNNNSNSNNNYHHHHQQQQQQYMNESNGRNNWNGSSRSYEDESREKRDRSFNRDRDRDRDRDRGFRSSLSNSPSSSSRRS